MTLFRSLAISLLLPGLLMAVPRLEDKAKASAPKAHPVVGCKDTKMYHEPDCKWVKEIDKAGTRMDFPSISAAKKAHMKPCGDCIKKKQGA